MGGGERCADEERGKEGRGERVVVPEKGEEREMRIFLEF